MQTLTNDGQARQSENFALQVGKQKHSGQRHPEHPFTQCSTAMLARRLSTSPNGSAEKRAIQVELRRRLQEAINRIEQEFRSPRNNKTKKNKQEKIIMTEDDAYGQREWLEAADLDEQGNNVTITSVEENRTQFTGDARHKVRFKEFDKSLTLFRRSQFRRIAQILGEPNSDRWGDRRIKLIPITIRRNGEEPKEVIDIVPADELAQAPEKPKPTLSRRARNSEPTTARREVDDDGERIPF
jgi:hypothetical protein